MKKRNGTLSLVKWTVISLLVCTASLAQANTWTHSGSTITDANGWVLKVAAQTINGVAGLSLTIDAVSTKGTPTGVLDLSGTISDGSNIVEIADYAFRSSSAGTLYSVTLPNTVIRIGGNTFSGQASLTNVTPFLPPSVKIIGTRAFYGNPVQGALDMSSVTNMEAGDAHFRSTAITSVVFCANLTTIRTYAFQGCGSLRSAQLPNNVVTIESYAFANCSILSNIVSYLSTTVKTIGDQAFISVPAIQAADLSSITNFGQQVFRWSGITSVVFSADLKTINERDFDSCARLVSAQLPANLVTMGNYAFNGCSALKTVTPFLPDTTKTLGTQAFNGCTSLTNGLRLMNTNITIMQQQTFASAPIGSVMLNGSVTSIVDYAFDGNTAIKQFWFCGGVPTFGTGCFRSLAAYTTRFYASTNQSGWSTFTKTPLSPTESNSFHTSYPAQPYPVGTWTPSGASGKQWLIWWQSPNDPPPPPPKGTVISIR